MAGKAMAVISGTAGMVSGASLNSRSCHLNEERLFSPGRWGGTVQADTPATGCPGEPVPWETRWT